MHTSISAHNVLSMHLCNAKIMCILTKRYLHKKREMSIILNISDFLRGTRELHH